MIVIYQKNHGIITASTVYTYIELQKSSNGPFTPESGVRTALAKNRSIFKFNAGINVP